MYPVTLHFANFATSSWGEMQFPVKGSQVEFSKIAGHSLIMQALGRVTVQFTSSGFGGLGTVGTGKLGHIGQSTVIFAGVPEAVFQ